MRLLKIILLTIFVSLILPLDLRSHKESTHQYIVREALNLLEMELGYTITDLNNWTGTTQRRNDGTAQGFYYGHIVCGAWSEDHYDVVYKEHFPPWWTYIVDVAGLPIELVFVNPDCLKRLYRASLVSVTHFWDVDKGDNYLTTLTPGIWIADDELKNKPNALQKAFKYAYGGFDFDYFNPLHTGNDLYNFQSNGLLHIWNNNQLFVNRQYNYLGRTVGWNYWKILDGNFSGTRKIFVYNMLGRIAHLLADMSVPAHVHNDEHGTLPDHYENKMRYEDKDSDWFDACDGSTEYVEGNPQFVERWDAKSVFEEKGGFVNPYCYPSGWEPIKYLMYTMAQISDHFASRRTSGDDNYLDIGEIEERIQDDLDSDHPGPTVSTNNDYSHSDDDLKAIRDVTFPYAIRATAGLLYWFAVESGQVPDPEDCDDYDYVLQPPNCDPIFLSGNNYTWQAENDLTVKGCSVEVSPGVYDIIDYTFDGAKNVTLRAGNEVKLEDGFSAKEGSEIKIEISQCEVCTYEEKNPS